MLKLKSCCLEITDRTLEDVDLMKKALAFESADENAEAE